jgi:hypothetical protein
MRAGSRKRRRKKKCSSVDEFVFEDLGLGCME